MVHGSEYVKSEMGWMVVRDHCLSLDRVLLLLFGSGWLVLNLLEDPWLLLSCDHNCAKYSADSFGYCAANGLLLDDLMMYRSKSLTVS